MVRAYSALLRAEAEYPLVAGPGSGFNRVAGYIFGGNTARGSGAPEKIAMTVRGKTKKINKKKLGSGCRRRSP